MAAIEAQATCHFLSDEAAHGQTIIREQPRRAFRVTKIKRDQAVFLTSAFLRRPYAAVTIAPVTPPSIMC